MNEYAFKVIDAINRAGIDSGSWGLVEDIEDTKAYFGTAEEIALMGRGLSDHPCSKNRKNVSNEL